MLYVDYHDIHPSTRVACVMGCTRGRNANEVLRVSG
jgi:hypothetical protein